MNGAKKCAVLGSLNMENVIHALPLVSSYYAKNRTPQQGSQMLDSSTRRRQGTSKVLLSGFGVVRVLEQNEPATNVNVRDTR